MYGDIIPGDTTHQDVVLLYHNYFKTAHRSLPKEKDKGKYEVWEMISTIIWVCSYTMITQFVNPSYMHQESFKRNKDDIIQKIKTDLRRALLPDTPPKIPLDESTIDLFRVFHIYIKDSVSIQDIRKEVTTDVSLKLLNIMCIIQLTQGLGREEYSYRNQAIELITQLDPKYYYSFFQKDDVLPSGAATTTHRWLSTDHSRTKGILSNDTNN